MRYTITEPGDDEAAVSVGGAEVRVRVQDRKLVIDVCADGGREFDDTAFEVYRNGQVREISIRVLRGGEHLTGFGLRRRDA